MVSIGRRLRTEREARAWSIAETVRRLRGTGIHLATTDASLARSIRRWESGENTPDATHQRALALAFDRPVLDLFAPDTDAAEHHLGDRSTAVGAEVDAEAEAEMIERIRRSDVDDATMDRLAATVERLCTAYSTEPADQLLVETRRRLGDIEVMVGGSPGRHARELHRQAAWLALLAGCLANDLGRRSMAESWRSNALLLAEDTGDARAAAWAFEMRVWFALNDLEPATAVATAEAGIARAPRSDVAVQMWGQLAEAAAKLGDHDQARTALATARLVLDALPLPENPGNHFVVDAPKSRKSEARVARLLGDHEIAERHARAMIVEGRRPDGSHRQPMRLVDSLATLAAIAAERGDAAEAIRLANEALDVDRVSQPSLRLVMSEVVAQLPSSPQASELEARVAAVGG